MEWSSCSVSDLNDGYDEGLDECLYNEPTNVRGEFLDFGTFLACLPVVSPLKPSAKIAYSEAC